MKTLTSCLLIMLLLSCSANDPISSVQQGYLTDRPDISLGEYLRLPPEISKGTEWEVRPGAADNQIVIAKVHMGDPASATPNWLQFEFAVKANSDEFSLYRVMGMPQGIEAEIQEGLDVIDQFRMTTKEN